MTVVHVETLLKDWDGEEVVIRYDRPTGAWIIIAVHNSQFGPPGGGTRMKPYPSLEAAVKDALSLSRAMTYKYAAADFPLGGAKAVINTPPDLKPEDRPGLLRRYGSLVKQLGGLFMTGPDVGTSPEDMDVVGETGSPHVRGRTEAAGGVGSSAPPTALGVFSGMEAVCERLFGSPSLAGRRVVVQGVGGVGASLIDLLRAAGAEILFTDVNEAAIGRFRDEAGLQFVSPDSVYDAPCDIFSPNALGGVINQTTIPRLNCKAVAGGANNQLGEPEDAERLRVRGILYAPDFVLNIGGAMAVTGMETMGWTREQANENVRKVRQNLRQILDMAEAEGVTPEAAARRLADLRIAAARP